MNRFTVRFNNGTFHLFDNQQYTAVRSFGLRKAADRAAEERNANRRPQR